MMNFLYKLIFKIKNLNLITAIKVFYTILTKNYSKYPKYLNAFEKKAKNYFQANYALTFSSGSAAFYAALKSLNLKPNSKVLISSMTFPSIVKILSNQDLEIIFYEIDLNFQPLNIKINIKDINLIVITHPFGFFSDSKNFNFIKNDQTKIIFDCSHVHGLKIDDKNINNFCDIAFFSMQGNKAISGGEGGLVLTDNKEYYMRMVNSHHPNHYKNQYSAKFTGVVNDIKLRMHPIASLIALKDLYNLESRNKELGNKFEQIYKYLNTINFVRCPKFDKNKTAGFHYGLPFYINKKEDLLWPIIKYNWPISYDNKFDPNENNKIKSILSDLYFVDLNWIKKNSLNFILFKLKKIFQK